MVRGAWRTVVHGVTKESDMTERLTLSLFTIVMMLYIISTEHIHLITGSLYP